MTNDDLLSRRPRTRLKFSDADMARLRDLYYDRDVPMTKIAAAFGLSTSTLFPIRTQPHRAASPHPAGSAGHPLPQGEREHQSQLLDPHKLALDVAVAARQELAHMGDVSGPMTLVERKRRADIIASLSRSIERIDKTFEARSEREALKRQVKELQDRLWRHENAGMLEAQSLALAALKHEFAAVSEAKNESAPHKTRR
jgi:transposase-like protein